MHIKTTIGTNKRWYLYTDGIYRQGSEHGKYTPGDMWGLYKQLVFIYRWPLEQVWLYLPMQWSVWQAHFGSDNIARIGITNENVVPCMMGNLDSEGNCDKHARHRLLRYYKHMIQGGTTV